MRLQRSFYDRMKGYARDVVGDLGPDLRKYFLEYQREFTEIKGLSSKQELLSALHQTHVAICGDYHTLAQAQRTVIRLLRDSLADLRQRGRRVVLALEMIRFRDTAQAAEFLSGRLTEAEFLRAIGFEKNWGFNWDNYRQLFEFARTHRIPVVGINSENRGRQAALRERDQFAARVIGSLLEHDPDITVVALIGDLHLAGPHLPAALRNVFRQRGLERTITVIHQNHERLYWKLAARKLETKVDVVKLRDGVFCVMNTPPWVKLQSYLHWHQFAADPDLDVGDEVRELVAIIREFLGVPKELDDDFRIVSPGDFAFLDRLAEEGRLERSAIRCLRRCLEEGQGLFIAEGNHLYLNSLSINQVASQAAQYLHAKLSGARHVFANPRTDFYATLWEETLGYLGSKILNPRRKCPGPEELAALSQRRKGVAPKTAALTLRHLRAQAKGGRGFSLPQHPSPREAALYFQVARRLAKIFGTALHAALLDGKVSRQEVRTLFETDFSKLDAKAEYLSWSKRLLR